VVINIPLLLHPYTYMHPPNRQCRALSPRILKKTLFNFQISTFHSHASAHTFRAPTRATLSHQVTRQRSNTPRARLKLLDTMFLASTGADPGAPTYKFRFANMPVTRLQTSTTKHILHYRNPAKAIRRIFVPCHVKLAFHSKVPPPSRNAKKKIPIVTTVWHIKRKFLPHPAF
jgi:hypothetical protein